MRIPFAAGAMINLHKPHPALHQPPRHQAAATEGFRILVAKAVQLLGGLRFLGEIHRLGRGSLHPVGQFIGADAGLEFALAFARLEMLLVQLAQYLELVSARFRGHPLGQI